MPFHTQSIGADTFDDMRGSLKRTGENLQVFGRLGKDGTGFRRTGAQGQRFRLVTVKYQLTFTTATTVLDGYQTYRVSDPQAVVHNSVAMGNYQVIDVQEISRQAVTSVVESILTNPQVRQVCQWILQG